MEVGEREMIYLSLHCHHQNDFCIKVGNDESHFNVSLFVKDTVTRQSADSNRGPSAYQLGQTGSHGLSCFECCFTSTEIVGLLGTGAQDGHLDFHAAPEL